MRADRKILLTGAAIVITILVFSVIFIKNSHDQLRNSQTLGHLQKIQRGTAELGADLGNLQFSVKGFVDTRRKSQQDSIKAFSEKISLKIDSLRDLSKGGPLQTGFDSIEAVFGREIVRNSQTLAGLSANADTKERLQFFEVHNNHFAVLWTLLGTSSGLQQSMVESSILQQQELSDRSFKQSMAGFVLILLILCWVFFDLYRKSLKQIKRESECQSHLSTLSQTEIQITTIINNSPSLIYLKDVAGRLLMVNKRFAEQIGLNQDEVAGKSFPELAGKDGSSCLSDDERRVVEERITLELLEKLDVVDAKKDFMTVKFPLINDRGEVAGIGCISTDLTEHIQLDAKLKKVQAKAEKIKKVQEKFLASMGQGIITPINGISGMTNLLYTTSLSVQQKKFLDAIRLSADNLIGVINSILDYSKINAGLLNLQNAAFDIDEVAHQVIATFKRKAAHKGISLKLSIAPNVPLTVSGDALRLTQILSNLVANAIKFTDKGAVELEIRHEVPWFKFYVKDTGIGIAEDQVDKIFAGLSHPEIPEARSYDGTKLGLAIVKELVDMHRGKVSVSSCIGEGSTFEVIIPYKISRRPEVLISKNSGQYNVLKGKTALVADKNSINRLVASQTLKKAGMIVELATDAHETLSLVETRHYDAILLDVNIPDRGGIDVCKKIRNDISLKVPIIAMSSSTIADDRERCLNSGMNDYILKPFVPEELFDKLKRLV